MNTLRSLAALACLAAPILAACSGPPVPSTLDDEEMCLDYAGKGGDKMLGGLRVPVTLTILDGKNKVFQATLHGMKSPKGPKTQIMLPDANAEYTVEWAQCANKRAERRAAEGLDPAWQCGQAKVYKTDKLVTKKGDAASRNVRWVMPPDATCWIAETPLPTPPAASGSPDGAK